MNFRVLALHMLSMARPGSEYYKTVYGPYLRCEAAGFIGRAAAAGNCTAWRITFFVS
jgi:hypothetical protein